MAIQTRREVRIMCDNCNITLTAFIEQDGSLTNAVKLLEKNNSVIKGEGPEHYCESCAEIFIKE